MPIKPLTTRLFHQNVMTHSMEVVADYCLDLIGQRKECGGKPALVFAMNPEKSLQSHNDPEIRQLLQSADVLLPDGIGTCIGARLLRGVHIKRVTGSELMPALCDRAEREGLSVFVYGATPESNAGALANMRRIWPRLHIAGAAHGYLPPGTRADLDRTDSDTVAARIRDARPDIVFVGLGSPRQERWMAEVGIHLPVALFQGVGGTIDVLSGAATRAPQIWQSMGLEWLYRLLENPRRWRRQLALPRYASLVLAKRLASGRRYTATRTRTA